MNFAARRAENPGFPHAFHRPRRPFARILLPRTNFALRWTEEGANHGRDGWNIIFHLIEPREELP